MSFTSLEIAYRPIRIAVVIEAGSESDFLTACKLNSRVWGGLTNPILEFGNDPESTFGMIESFMPDALFHVNEGLSKAPIEARFPELSLRTVALRLLDEESPGLVNLESICHHYSEKVFRFDRESSRAASVEWPDDHAMNALFTASFGDLSGGESDRFRRAFDSISGKSFELSESIDPAIADSVYPARLTTDSLRTIPGRNLENGVFVGTSSDVSDLAAFWNIRATGSSVAFYPLDQPGSFDAYLARFLEQLAAVQASGDITVWQADRDEKVTEWILKEANSLDLLTRRTETVQFGPEHGAAGATWRTESASVLASADTQENGATVIAATLPERPFVATRDRIEAWSSHWIIDISTFGEHELSDMVVRLPSVMALDPWASDLVSVIGDVRLRSGQLGIVVNESESHTTFRAVPIEALSRQLFATAGLSAETSPAGQATKRIIAQMNGLHGTRPLRLPGVRKLFQRSGSNFDWNAALATIHDDGSFSAYKNVGTARQVFERLLEKAALQARLRIPCPSCTIAAHYPPDALGTSIRCERCDSPFHLSTRLHKSKWCYRPSGFFANHQEHGAIPVILAMMRLHMDCRDAILAPSMNLLASGVNCETDLVLIDRSRDGDVLVGVGECKGGDEEIDETDIAHLKQIAEMLQQAGLSAALIFATTRSQFSETERDLLRKLRSETRDVSLVLLTAFELESLYTYQSLGGKEGLPARYVHSLRDLARNSEFLHLDDGLLPDSDEELTKLFI